MNFVLMTDELYKKGIDGSCSRCLSQSDKDITLGEVHKGICGAHQAGVKMKWWVEAVPLTEAGQNEIIDFIEEYIIHQFEISQTLSIDQGTMFIGQRIKNFAASRNITMVTSTPYYAQANGQVEAANKILINLIKKQIGRKPRTWHETLSQVLWAYRNSPRGLTNTSPYKLVYGHDAVLPFEINLNTLRVMRQDDLPIEDY
ncbi:uncharacterized protein LOC107607721 [Arachis ipaensis]|uniref:uncharacterized protein LOC107607721 n=1 Tax=Arachis ipaensis TaxID=130454 RepID=UPI0007AF630A|nr:uncharacterized protein LOC107607721 [Arachis ipaensis]XP_025665164.1 uncharacterized protein LOC112763801 [Arachis hypogaea]